MATRSKKPSFRSAAPASVVTPIDTENASAAVSAIERSGADLTGYAKTVGNRIRNLETALGNEQAAHRATDEEWERLHDEALDKLATEHKAELSAVEGKLAAAERSVVTLQQKLAAADVKLAKAEAIIGTSHTAMV